jgi:hypothetical protein
MTEFVLGKDRYHEIDIIRAWCIQQFGYAVWHRKDEDRWSWESSFGNTGFYFRDEADASLFALKWL